MASSLALLELRMRSILGYEKEFERLTPRETLRRVAHDGVTISRFGNGELRFCLKHGGSRFQPYLPEFTDRLLRALLEPKDGVLTCFSHTFRDTPSPEWVVRFNPKPYDAYRTAREPNDIGILHRRAERNAYVARWNTVAKRTAIRTYGDTNVFRLSLYVPEYLAGETDAVLEDFCRLFRGKRILFVTAREPHYGGSFEDKGRELAALGVEAAEFIDIPAVGAAAEAERVEREILARARGMTDVFLQAGPLATVLSYELAGRIDARLVDSGALNAQVPYLVEHVGASTAG